MKRISFTEHNRSDNILHIEIPNAIVNIYINLHDREGNKVEIIEIIPNNDYKLNGSSISRVIKQ